jgi:enoyl-CoA hydratase/carnithine racemase
VAARLLTAEFTAIEDLKMQCVRYERSGDVGHVVLANPPDNLLNVQFYEELRIALEAATAQDIRALLVRAEGPNFSAGGDVAVLARLSPAEFRLLTAEYNRSFRAIEALQIPTVAAVRGRAFGGGVELALSCDFIVAAHDAVFRQIEVSVGSMPIAGGVQRMAERVGRTRAALYAMLTTPFSGETAGELGLASFVVPDEEVEGTARDLASQLASGPTRSYAAVRQVLKAWSSGGVAGADAVMLDIALPLHATADAARGRAARAEALARGEEPKPVTFQGR